MVSKYQVPNYLGARISVLSGLNIPVWRNILQHYDLSIIADYLEFGFPVNIDKEFLKNHISAQTRSTGVDKYFDVEVKAILISFQDPPCKNMNYSPLLASYKPDRGVRVIVDLSWPKENNMNSCIPDGVFDDMDFILKYPNIDLVLQKIR